ncbi:MAG: ATP-binding protein [Nostoc sp.]|uniref:ATP-binding protein n=1 Tax=Nostoc sp. TaxID=1180 RepID=UPI002FFBF7BC
MASIQNSPEEKFTEAAHNWDLERLYKDLELSKRQVAPHKRKGLTEIEKLHLRGLLCANSPDEIAKKLCKNSRGLNADLCETIYRYVETLTNRLTNTLENWRDIYKWLEEAGYKARSSSSVLSHTAANHKPQESVSEIPVSNNCDFVGREEAIAHLNNLVNEGAKVILIHAEGGIGKTTLAKKWFELQGLEYLDLRVGTTPQNLNSLEDWIRVKLRYDFKENPEQDFMTMMEQFQSRLQEQRMGVLIHHLEFALINGEFIESHNSNYIALLTVLAHQSVQSVTLITSSELLYEPDLIKLKSFQDYWLPELKHKAWRDYFVSRNITIDTDALYEINRAYGGNAFAMYLLSPEILNESQGNLKAYWQDNCDDLLRHPTLENLEKLVQRQFNKLQQDNPQAYKLLCHLGCYRYQYIPVISEKGIFCLLWDEQNERNKLRFIRDLKNRALVKFSSEGYYLYELIRQEAIERLKLTDDWKQSHAKAGIFLSTLISNNCQTIIPKITCTKVNDTQEQMYLNIENAEIAVKQELTKQ